MRALLPLVAALFAGCAATGGDEPVRTTEVVIPGAWVFEPSAIVVAVGANVTWRNDGGQAHSVTFPDLRLDRDVAPGATVTLAMTQAGTFGYTCKYHPPDMRGSVVVEG